MPISYDRRVVYLTEAQDSLHLRQEEPGCTKSFRRSCFPLPLKTTRSSPRSSCTTKNGSTIGAEKSAHGSLISAQTGRNAEGCCPREKVTRAQSLFLGWTTTTTGVPKIKREGWTMDLPDVQPRMLSAHLAPESAPRASSSSHNTAPPVAAATKRGVFPSPSTAFSSLPASRRRSAIVLTTRFMDSFRCRN